MYHLGVVDNERQLQLLKKIILSSTAYVRTAPTRLLGYLLYNELLGDYLGCRYDSKTIQRHENLFSICQKEQLL